MSKRRIVAWVVAAAVGTMLVPTVDAVAATKQQKREIAQNKRITKVVKQARTTALKVASVASTLGNLNKIVGERGQQLVDLTTLVHGIDGRVKTIEAGVPAVFDALTKLGDAAKQLKDGLTAVGAGLTKLGSAYQAVEYGRAGIFAGDADLTIAAGGTVTSADIPDDGNAITTGEDAIVVAGAGATNESLDLKAGIRSAESDGGPNEGGSSSTTAGQAGGYIFVVDNDTGARKACIGAPNPPGIFGTTPGDPIVTPSGTVNTLPLKNLPGGFERTDTTQPNSSSTSLLPAACTFAATPGHTYEVHYSVNFVDIPTSTTPGPTE
jgi:hypothetical protein